MKAGFGWIIGDPHLGRKFEVGVPAHRKGEREREQLYQFREELAQPGDMVVMIGDLFDHPYVPHNVVSSAIAAAIYAAKARPRTTFVHMAGNHDVPRKLTATGAFSVFQQACNQRLPNLRVLTQPAVVDGVAFFPWEWDRTALEQVEDLKHEDPQAIVGHWDLASFGGEDLHLAPVAALRDAFGEVPIYSGHYHASRTYTVQGVDIIGTGSMQPYGHAEDPEGLIYITVDLADLDVEAVKDKCVRVRLRPGEDLPDGVDCRSIIGQRVAGVAAPESGQQIGLDDFDWTGIVKRALEPLDPEVKAFIEDRLPSHGSSE